MGYLLCLPVREPAVVRGAQHRHTRACITISTSMSTQMQYDSPRQHLCAHGACPQRNIAYLPPISLTSWHHGRHAYGAHGCGYAMHCSSLCSTSCSKASVARQACRLMCTWLQHQAAGRTQARERPPVRLRHGGKLVARERKEVAEGCAAQAARHRHLCMRIHACMHPRLLTPAP